MAEAKDAVGSAASASAAEVSGIDFAALIAGDRTGGDAGLQLDVTTMAMLDDPGAARWTQHALDDVRLDAIRRDPFTFFFDDRGVLAIVVFGEHGGDLLDLEIQRAISDPHNYAPSGILALGGHSPAQFATLSGFAATVAKDVPFRLSTGRSYDRWLQFVAETPQARLVAEFLLKVVKSDDSDTHRIDYALYSLSAVSRHHMNRCGEG